MFSNKKEEKQEKDKDKKIKGRSKSLSGPHAKIPSKTIAILPSLNLSIKKEKQGTSPVKERMHNSEGNISSSPRDQSYLNNTANISTSHEVIDNKHIIQKRPESTSSNRTSPRSTSPSKRHSIHPGMFSSSIKSSGSNSIDSSLSSKNSHGMSLEAESTELKIKQFSYEQVLLEQRLTHEYLFSLTQDQIVDFHRQAKSACHQLLHKPNGCFSFQPDYKKSSPKGINNLKPPQLIVSMKDSIMECILCDRNIQLGGVVGAGGDVFIGYPISDLIDHNWCATLIDSMVVVKDKKPLPTKEQIDLAVTGLKITKKYINHFDCDSSVFYIMKPVNGCDFDKLVYKCNPEPPKPAEDPEGYINAYESRRYVKVLTRIDWMIELVRSMIAFHQHPYMHVDIKEKNFVHSRVYTEVSPSGTLDLVDMDDVTHIETLFRKIIGTPGKVVPELRDDSKFPNHFTQKSDIYALGLIISVLACHINYLRQIRCEQVEKQKQWLEKETSEKKEEKFVYPDDFTHQDYCRILSPIFSDLLPIELLDKNIINTWMNLPTTDLFTYILPTLKDVMKEDRAILSEDRAEIINEIVFQFYILPSIIIVLLNMVCEDPAKRISPEEMPGALNELLELRKLFIQLSVHCNNQGPRKTVLTVPDLEEMTREKVMQMAVKTEPVEKREESIRISFK